MKSITIKGNKMATANEILHDQTIIIASYLTWIKIPDVQNIESREARDKAIEDFKEDIVYRLTSEVQLLVGSALFIYTYFDTQDEEVRLQSWQDKTEAITGTLAAFIEAIKTRVEYLCNKAKACEFIALPNRAQVATNLVTNMGDRFSQASGSGASSSHEDEDQPLLGDTKRSINASGASANKK